MPTRTAVQRDLTRWGLIALLFAASPRAVAAISPIADPEATIVDELVVTSKTSGPAWWRVSSPSSTVYILGTAGALPKGLKWDTAAVRRRLSGANTLIGPPKVSANLGDVFALLSIQRHYRSKTPVEQTLPPELRARFLADRTSLSSDPRAYSGWTALAAGLIMVSDFRKRARLDPQEPQAAVVRLAREMGVSVTPAGAYRAVPILRAAETGLATSGPACMADALDEIEAGAGRVKIAAEGWARGDVATALTAQRGYEKCVNSLPEGADVITRAMSDTTLALDQALAKPGHSVAVVNLRLLLARGGVLQRLKAKGFTIAAPDRN
jgi:uncharacterized protein YbaP (TraB family)